MSTQDVVHSSSGARLRDDRVLPEVRAVAVFVVFILGLAVSILYFMPEKTDAFFAWTIKPSLMAMAMGAGYVMGMYFFARVALVSRWHYATVGFLPITMFTIWMLLATFLHADRFNQGTLAFFLWTLMYIITPILVPFLWFRNRVTDPGNSANELQVPIIVRGIAGIIGVAFVAFSVISFLFPDLLIAFFPWQLTPLTARVLAGWLSFPGVGALVMAREPRWSSWRLLVEAVSVGIVFFLLAVPRAWNDLIQNNPFTWVLLIVLIGSLILFPLLYVFMERQKVIG